MPLGLCYNYNSRLQLTSVTDIMTRATINCTFIQGEGLAARLELVVLSSVSKSTTSDLLFGSRLGQTDSRPDTIGPIPD